MSWRAELRSRAHSAEQARRQVDAVAEVQRRVWAHLARRSAQGFPPR